MDFTKIKPEFRKEIVRGGEAYLESQLRVATAADSRASSLAGIFTAAATAMTAGVVIAIFNAATGDIGARIMMLSGAAAAGCFLMGAVLCFRSIMPVKFNVAGCEPGNWAVEIASGADLDDCYGERADHIAEQIEDNRVIMERNARLFKWGARFGISAPFVGMAVGGLFFLFRFA